MVVYQSSGEELFWMNADTSSPIPRIPSADAANSVVPGRRT